MAASCCDGESPAGSGATSPSLTAWRTSATRTMKNSSRFDATIAANLTRSSSAFVGSVASSSTRSLNASHESSRLMKCSGRLEWEVTTGHLEDG